MSSSISLCELNLNELEAIDGGCVGCKIGITLMSLGFAVAVPSPWAFIGAGVSIYTTWA